MKKILLTLAVLFAVSGFVSAKVTVEEVRSNEYMTNEGYSQVMIQTVQKEAGTYNPKPTNKYQKFGFRLWKYIDPAAPEARDEVRHDIKMYPTYSDL